MKFVYYIKDDWTLGEGYIFDDYFQDTLYKYTSIYSKDSKLINIAKSECIYDNLDTAKHMLKGMIQIQIDKNSKEIEKLQKENEILFEKTLNV